MTRSRLAGCITALVMVGIFVLIVVVSGPSPQAESGQVADPPRKPREPGKPIPMSASLVTLEITFGLKDTDPTNWSGNLELSEGTLKDVAVARGGPKATATGGKFTIRSIRPANQPKMLNRPMLRVGIDAPAGAKLTVNTPHGKFTFAMSDIAVDETKNYLDDQVSVERHEGVLRLTGKETEDDHPVMVRAADGTIWMAYVEYQPGPQILTERVLAGNFDLLVPRGHGDQIRLVRFDGKVWHPAIDATEPALDIWRPTIAVDGKGAVHLAWAQNINGDWEILHRRYTPAKDGGQGQWSEIERITNAPGSDFNVVAATDASGTVWIAWQGWRKDNFDIFAAALADGHARREPKAISTSKANDWEPAIAADSKGNVYIAWDTYDKGNYDLMLHTIGPRAAETRAVASSAKAETRAALVCDAKDRLWIAYEEGDEQWGKDYSNEQFKRIGLEKNPGFPLYQNRTIQVKCLADGKLMRPAGTIPKVFPNAKREPNHSYPRLAADTSGGVWLLFRQHPLAGGAGEVWNSVAVRHDGKGWSAPRRLSASANLMDNKPALAPLGKGLVAVYSGDNRIRTQNRDQDDLYATLLNPTGETQELQLVADPAPAAAQVPIVHKDEAADIARLRAFQIEVGGKKLKPVRGEFHRHTEYSSHRDQDGSLVDSWRYALDAADMDWMGNGDHDNGFHHEYQWWQIQKITDLHHNAPRFVAAMTYERSNVYPNGHRNVIMPRRGIRPLPRGVLAGSAEKGTPDTKILYAYLKHFGGICASHTSGTNMGTDWRDNDPNVEPVVEIYQGHRHNYEHPKAPRAPTEETQIGGYQPAGYVWNALEKGYRLGFQTSSDHMSTHMSYGMVFVEEASRQGIIDGFKKHHSYGATDNILLNIRCGDYMMGDIFETNKRPTLDIHVHGTGPVAKVHIIRDNKYVYTAEPKKEEVKLRYTDMDAKAGQTSYYYIRVEQADGNLAWGSPMWITYKP